jgi:hypothetical protein
VKYIIRFFVVVLALTGASATSQASNTSAGNRILATRTGMLPVPTCAPNDPNACGMGH